MDDEKERLRDITLILQAFNREEGPEDGAKLQQHA